MSAPLPTVAISASCPLCRSAVRTLRNRQDGREFCGCSAYPRCKWTGPADAILQALAQELAAEKRRARESRSSAPAAPVTARDLRALLAWAHPDRHSSGQIPAHEVAVRLSALLTNARSAA